MPFIGTKMLVGDEVIRFYLYHQGYDRQAEKQRFLDSIDSARQKGEKLVYACFAIPADIIAAVYFED